MIWGGRDGRTGISKSEVSPICGQLDTEVAVWRTRTLDHTAFPYVVVDATYCKVGLNGRVVSAAVVIATGVMRAAPRRGARAASGRALSLGRELTRPAVRPQAGVAPGSYLSGWHQPFRPTSPGSRG